MNRGGEPAKIALGLLKLTVPSGEPYFQLGALPAGVEVVADDALLYSCSASAVAVATSPARFEIGGLPRVWIALVSTIT